MKTTTSILAAIFILTISCCGKEPKTIQGNWIEKYIYFNPTDSIYSCEKRIFSFKEDKIRIQNFYFENEYNNEKIKEGLFKIKDESLYLTFSEKSDTLQIKFDERGQLILKDGELFKVFEKLEEFKTAKYKEQIKKDFAHSIFSFSHDTIRFEILEDSRYAADCIDRDLPSSQLWNIEEFNDELFFVFSSSLGPAHQITKIEDDTIHFKFYNRENENLKFHKVNSKLSFDNSLLIGKWEKQLTNEFDNEELTEISDSTFTKISGARIEKQKWLIGKLGNVIILEEAWKRERKPQWNIKSLTEDKLVITRNVKSNFKSKVEDITFKNKK